MRAAWIVLWSGLSLAVPAAAEPADVQALAWLQGCWAQRTPERIVEEQWMAPRAGTMLGMSRTVRGDKLVAHESVLLREHEGRFEYAVSPSGQAPTVFTSISVGANRVVFENPEHDFPQRVAYARDGSELRAWIEGTLKGQPRRVDYRYQRVACNGAD
ncbi:MAG TPA: DUF6265 family protein [Burkholderiaceae bacterium]|nr:DUF6265 family protein [Burkholderiaceae bacterium]